MKLRDRRPSARSPVISGSLPKTPRHLLLQLRSGEIAEGHMLRDAPIRTKLIAIFILPALGTATLAALRIAVDFRDGLRADREKRAAVLALDAVTLAHELGAERDSSAAWLVGDRAEGARSGMLAARLRVGRAAGAFRSESAGLGHTGWDPRVGFQLEAALADLERLAATRRSVDRLPVTATDTISAYGHTVGGVLDVAARLPANIPHRELARDLDAVVALAQAEESASFERGLGTAV